MPREASLDRNRSCGKRPVVTHTESTVPILGTLKAVLRPASACRNRPLLDGSSTGTTRSRPRRTFRPVKWNRKSSAPCAQAIAFMVTTLGATTAGSSTYEYPRLAVAGTASSCNRRRLDQPVTPQTSLLRRHHSADAEHVSNGPVLRNRNLRADLDSRDPVLVHDGVEKKSRPHRVRCEEKKVAVRKMRCHILVEEIPRHRLDLRFGVRTTNVAGRHPDFGSPQSVRNDPRHP